MRALGASLSRRSPQPRPRGPAAHARAGSRRQQQQLVCRHRRHRTPRAGQQPDSVLPEDVDLNDPELQAQIDALLRELDPDLLLVRPLL